MQADRFERSRLPQHSRRTARRIAVKKRRDEVASLAVIESVLTAILVLSAMVFMTSLQRPSDSSNDRGFDLAKMAADAITLTQDRSSIATYLPNHTDGPFEYRHQMEEWISESLVNNATAQAELDAFMADLLSNGTRYAIQLDNGIGAFHIMPVGQNAEPRGARGASGFIVPQWQQISGGSHEMIDDSVTSYTVYPGQSSIYNTTNYQADQVLQLAKSWTCLRSPANNLSPDLDSSIHSSQGPWTDVWNKSLRPTATDGVHSIPDNIPYGVWHASTAADCTQPDSFTVRIDVKPRFNRVAMDDTDIDEIEFPVYGVNVVVWFGA